jgi:hypothetical protein
MSFVIDRSGFLRWPVKFSRATDGGEWKDEQFHAHIKKLSQDRIAEIVKTNDDGSAALTDLDLAKELLVGWEDDCKDEGDKALSYSPQNRDLLLTMPNCDPPISSAVVQAWLATLGKPKPTT